MIDWSRIFPEKVYVINHKLIVALQWVVQFIAVGLDPIHAYALQTQSRCVFNIIFLRSPRFFFVFVHPSSMNWQPNVQANSMLSMRQTSIQQYIYLFMIRSWIWLFDQTNVPKVNEYDLYRQIRQQIKVAITQWHTTKVQWSRPEFFFLCQSSNFLLSFFAGKHTIRHSDSNN